MRKTLWITGLSALGTTATLAIASYWGGDLGLGRASALMTAFGLVLSAYVATAVTEIRGRYVRQAMLKDCHKRLQSCQRNLKTAVTRNDPEDALKQLTLARTIFQ